MKSLALAALTVAACTGCSGVNTTQSFSPLTFFLPGLASAKSVPPQIVPLSHTVPQAQLAANRDSAQAN